MITNSKGKYLPSKIVTTNEVIKSLDGVNRTIVEYLVKMGDIDIRDNIISPDRDEKTFSKEKVI